MDSNAMDTDEMRPMRLSRSAIMTPSQFIRMTPTQRANIKRTEILAPDLGGGFGRIRVVYKHPVRSK